MNAQDPLDKWRQFIDDHVPADEPPSIFIKADQIDWAQSVDDARAKLGDVAPETYEQLEKMLRWKPGARCAIIQTKVDPYGAISAHDAIALAQAAEAERLQALYSEPFMIEARAYAAEQGIPLDQAVALLHLRTAAQASIEDVTASFQALVHYLNRPEIRSVIHDIGATIVAAARIAAAMYAEYTPDALEQAHQPVNRHERRASRHKKPLEETDRKWTNSYRYKNRHWR